MNESQTMLQLGLEVCDIGFFQSIRLAVGEWTIVTCCLWGNIVHAISANRLKPVGVCVPEARSGQDG